MFESLKQYCSNTLDFSENELGLIDHYFVEKNLSRKEFLLLENTVCNFLAFVAVGTIRFFHIKEGNEKTCDIAFENAWVTDFNSFNKEIAGKMNLQAMENTKVFLIAKSSLVTLYQECPKYETFGRLMAENVAQRATEIAMSLSADKPEERFQNLIKNQPDIFQKIPQKYIANFLGISPESLSRIRNRIFYKKKD